MQKYLVCFLFFAVTVFNLNAQTRIEGLTQNIAGIAIPYVTLTINYSDTAKISAFGFSNATGKFSIIIKDSINHCTINATLLGFGKVRKSLNIEKNKSNSVDFILTEETIDIKSLTIRASRPPVKTRPDTITFRVKSFIDSSERVVEDVLKKLPGMQVDDNGGLKFQGKPVERILIEGDDLFNRDYKIPSKNLSANIIEEVQVIDRYSSNPLLKKLENSDRLVLNLNFKKDRIKRWFGNVNVGGGFENKYDASYNLITFTKKLKLFDLGNFNNIGTESNPEFNSDRAMSARQNTDFFDPEIRAKGIINAPLLPGLLLSRERFNFNNNLFNSLNFIDKPNDRFQIKGIAVIFKDRLEQFQNNQTQYLLGSQSFSTTDTQNVVSKPFFGKASLEGTYKVSEKSLLTVTTEYSAKKNETVGNTILNSDGFIQTLNDKFSYWRNLLSFTQTISDSLAVVLHATFSNDTRTQSFLINPSQNFNGLFISDSNRLSSTKQNAEVSTQYLGLEAHVLGVLQNGNKLSVKIGGSQQTDNLVSNIDLLFNKTENQKANAGFSNDLTYKESFLYAQTDYNKEIGAFNLTGKVGLNVLNGDLNNYLVPTNSYNKTWIYPDVRANIKWQPNYLNKFSLSYQFNNRSVDVSDLYTGYILNSYRNFSRNLISPTQIIAQTGILVYSYNDDFKNIWGFLNASYSRTDNGFSSRSNFTPQYSLGNRTNFAQPNEIILMLAEVSKLFSAQNLSVKLSAQQSWINSYESVLNSDFSKNTNWSSTYGISLVSTYAKFFNFSVGGNWSRNLSYFGSNTQIEPPSSKNVKGYLKFRFNFSGKTFFFITNELYYSKSDFTETPKHFFTDFELTHTITPQKLTFFLDFKNIFNVTDFVSTSVSAYQSNFSSYRLIPRYLVAKFECRF